MKLSIIIPVYNEEKTINKVIDAVQNVRLKGVEKEIIVVDDGSTDKTFETIKNRKDIELLRHKKNQGKGAAIRTGIKYATGNIILIQDADLEYNPNEYGILIKPIINGEAQVVYGSRNLKSRAPSSGLSYFIGGHALTFLSNLLYRTKITDEATCYKVFNANVIKNINLKCKRFEFCPEITAKIAKKGIKIYEVPISYKPRTKKEGKKIRWRDGFEAVWTLIKYRFVN